MDGSVQPEGAIFAKVDHHRHQQRQARAALPITDDEREATLELVRWFTRRYPTPADRLRYAREAGRPWARAMPPASDG